MGSEKDDTAADLRDARASVAEFRADAGVLRQRTLWVALALSLGACALCGGRTDVALGILLGGAASALKLHLSTAALVAFALHGGKRAARRLVLRRLGVYGLMALVLAVAFRYDAFHAPAACAALFLGNAVVIGDEIGRRRAARAAAGGASTWT